MSSSVHEQLKAAATQNHELLGTLSDTDYAPPALEQHKGYIKDLQKQLERADKSLKSLEQDRLRELEDHEKYRDSVMRRFAYKVARKEEKFSQKAHKEEREYFEALQKQHRAQQERQTLQANLDEAQKARQDLEEASRKHEQAQKQLNELYDGIFAGPTPAFPDEDAVEREVQQRVDSFNQAASQRENAVYVVRNLEGASACMQKALDEVEQALDASRFDMFGGGAMADMMERSALGRAEAALGKADNFIQQARRFDSRVAALPPTAIAQGNLMSDVLFDNIFTDMAFHDKIKQSQQEVQASRGVAEGELRAARRGLEEAKHRQQQCENELGEARRRLQKSREQVFASLEK